jgi:HlyD family secretion protein
VDIVRTQKKSRRRPVLIGIGLVALIAATVALTRLDPALPTVERAAVLVDTVKRGDVVREVRGPGTLVPEHIRWITAQASARVERVHVESGREVAQSELLLELSNPDLQIQTMQAEQQARQAEIDLINLRTNLRSAILTQEGTVASTRTQWVSSSQEARAADSLVRLGLVPAFEVANRKAAAAEFTTRYRVEQERLSLMQGAIESQIEVQVARVAQLRAIAANQQARLRSLEVRAPEPGVLQELTLQLGQWVPEGTTLAKVVQPGRLKAMLRIPESQAKDVQLGQEATVDTRNGIVNGRVIRKDPSAQGGSVLIDVSLEGPLPAGAVPDLSIDGTITIDRMKHVLYAGRPASSAGTGNSSVFRLEADGKTAVRVPVVLGRSSVNTIEILQGLAHGDRIIISDLSSFATAEKIRIR